MGSGSTEISLLSILIALALLHLPPLNVPSSSTPRTSPPPLNVPSSSTPSSSTPRTSPPPLNVPSSSTPSSSTPRTLPSYYTPSSPTPRTSPRISPLFHIDHLRTNDQLNNFYRTLTNLVCSPPARHCYHRELDVLPFLASQTYGDFLTHVRLTDGTNQLTLLVRSHDLYIIGYRVNAGPAVMLKCKLPLIPKPFIRIGSFLVELEPEPLLDGFEAYMPEPLSDGFQAIMPEIFVDADNDAAEVALGGLGIRTTRISLGDSYPDLEFAGGARRMDMPINRNNLLNAFRGLINSHSEPEIARSILFFTQFISESLRINPIREFVIRHFELRVRIPDHLLVLEHGWGRASLILQYGNAHQHALEYGGTFNRRLYLREIDEIFAITLVKPHCPNDFYSSSYTRVNMWARYEYTLLEYERRRQEQE